MGAASSRVDDDKALLLCRDRRRYIRQALDGRCSLASAHVSYIQALRNAGMALGKLVEPEAHAVSSLYTSTSTSGTPEPLTMTEKSASQFSKSSPSMSQHVETAEPFSPSPSPSGDGRFRVNYMKSGGNYSTTVEERPPVLVKTTLQPSSASSPRAESHSYKNSDIDASPPPPGTPPWDYFDLFHPIDDRFSLQDGRAENHMSDGDTRQLREEEGIPDLEEEGEKSSINEKSEHLESEDEFDEPSSEPLVRIFKNRNEMLDLHLTNVSADIPSAKHTDSETKRSVEKTSTVNGLRESDETPSLTPKSTPPVTPFPTTERSECEKEFVGVSKIGAKDFLSSMKEVELLFLTASEAGKEVPRMLEANKVNFRPLFPEGQVHKSKRSAFFASLFACGRDGDYEVEEPASNEIKYLTWHQSVSSLSSLSCNPLGTTSGDGVGDASISLFSSVCMSSGSHVSTLDRLYAWERKLYDEVKASGVVRKEYDMKCKLLRQLDSKAKVLDLKEDNSNKIARTRAKVKDLHSRIRVAIQRIESISKTIEELRDKELQPQLEELIGGLLRMWETMLECHRRQISIISVSTSSGGSKFLTLSGSNQQAAGVLVYELNSLHLSFTKWISAHKHYLQSISDWLHKCIYLEKQKSSIRGRKAEFSPRRDVAPPIYITCKVWLEKLNNSAEVRTVEVADAVKEMVAEITHLMPREEKNHANTNLSFSLSRRNQCGELTEKRLHNEPPVNWSVCLDGLQQKLGVFLDRLKMFSENSVMMYVELGNNIINARNRYDSSETTGARV